MSASCSAGAARCPLCRRTVIQTTYAGELLALDPVPWTYATVDEFALVPEDNARVFRSLALVDHTFTCPVRLREQDEEHARTRQRRPRVAARGRQRQSRAPY